MMVPEYKCVFAKTRFALEFEVIDPNATAVVKVELVLFGVERAQTCIQGRKPCHVTPRAR
ncbi:hypothetical protein BA190_19260 [Labrys sp. WJW]|nr:hypothetical protein BA190_19260 [Labrys sp. WJW]